MVSVLTFEMPTTQGVAHQIADQINCYIILFRNDFFFFLTRQVTPDFITVFGAHLVGAGSCLLRLSCQFHFENCIGHL